MDNERDRIVHDDEMYEVKNMMYFNAQKQAEERAWKDARDQRQAERIAKKKARAKRRAAFVIAGTIALTGVGVASADTIKEDFSNVMEKFKVGQEYTDPLKELRERTGKTGEEIYSEYIDYIQDQRAAGFEVTQSQEGYKDFVENYDSYMSIQEDEKGVRSQ